MSKDFLEDLKDRQESLLKAPMQFSFFELDEGRKLHRPEWGGKGARPVAISQYLDFGDYDNSCHVERANVQVFLEIFGELEGQIFEHLAGWYGSEMIAIYTDVQWPEEMIEILESLENYPAIDDEAVSNMEFSMIEERWDTDYANDFYHAILDRYEDQPGYQYYETLDPYIDIDLHSDTLVDIRRYCEEKANAYPEVEAGGVVYFPIDSWIEVLPETYQEFINLCETVQ